MFSLKIKYNGPEPVINSDNTLTLTCKDGMVQTGIIAPGFLMMFEDKYVCPCDGSHVIGSWPDGEIRVWLVPCGHPSSAEPA